MGYRVSLPSALDHSSRLRMDLRSAEQDMLIKKYQGWATARRQRFDHPALQPTVG
jgi:hypothetical protein